jgi:Na+/proline symporter
VLFMLSTSLAQDLYRRFIRPDAADRQVLAVARGAAVMGGLAAMGLAVTIPTVIDALTVFYGLLTVVLFVPIVAALWLRRTQRPAALASVVAGLIVLVVVHVHTGGAGFAGWRPDTLGLCTAAGAFAVVLAARRRDQRD